MMVDLLRAPGESLAAYQERSQADVAGTWTQSLTQEEHDSFKDHMLKVQAQAFLMRFL